MSNSVMSLDRSPMDRASSLAELMSWHDVEFVRCAYATVLGRAPDSAGELFYAGRLRQGRSKLEILWQLRRSDEGRAFDPGIAGFDRALKTAAWARKPVVGLVVKWLTGAEGDSAAESASRRLLNEIGRIGAGQREIMIGLVRLEENMEDTAVGFARDPFSNAQSERTREVVAKLATAFPRS